MSQLVAGDVSILATENIAAYLVPCSFLCHEATWRKDIGVSKRYFYSIFIDLGIICCVNRRWKYRTRQNSVSIIFQGLIHFDLAIMKGLLYMGNYPLFLRCRLSKKLICSSCDKIFSGVSTLRKHGKDTSEGTFSQKGWWD